MPKYRVLEGKAVSLGGRANAEGSIVDVPKEQGDRWCRMGHCEPCSADLPRVRKDHGQAAQEKRAADSAKARAPKPAPLPKKKPGSKKKGD